MMPAEPARPRAAAEARARPRRRGRRRSRRRRRCASRPRRCRGYVVELGGEVPRPVVDEDLGELVEAEQDRRDGERDAQQQERLRGRVVAQHVRAGEWDRAAGWRRRRSMWLSSMKRAVGDALLCAARRLSGLTSRGAHEPTGYQAMPQRRDQRPGPGRLLVLRPEVPDADPAEAAVAGQREALADSRGCRGTRPCGSGTSTAARSRWIPRWPATAASAGSSGTSGRRDQTTWAALPVAPGIGLVTGRLMRRAT